MELVDRERGKYEREVTKLLRIQLEEQSRPYNERNPRDQMSKAYQGEDTHKDILGESLDRETLAYKHMESLERVLGIKATIGGHPLVTAQRNNQRYITRDKGIEARFKYMHWKEEEWAERMSEEQTITTPFLREEDYRMLLGQVKRRMDAHRGHIILIQTRMLEHVGETETQDMETIAEIQPNTLETLKAREAKEGQLSPKAKHNEAITILFKPGMEGNIYGIEGAIRRWAGHHGITGVRWKGTNGEQYSSDEQLGTQERRIAKWILHGKEAYPAMGGSTGR